MLKKDKISTVKSNTDEWHKKRLGKFTSSEIFKLMGDKWPTEGAISYVYDKVGEELTGKPANPEIETEATRWGHYHENMAIEKFGREMKLDFVVVQQLIIEPGTRYGSTPDTIIVRSESKDGTEYDVETGEVKCYPTYKAYMGLFLCETPEQVFKEAKNVFWQVIDQMSMAGAKRGHLIVYHPDFNAGNFKILTFDAMNYVVEKDGKKERPIVSALKFLNERKKLACELFDETLAKMSRYPRV